MGNAFLPEPNTFKNSFTGENDRLKFGSTEMQGWRTTQEDATIAELQLNAENSFFGVFDGHGGPEVSKYVENHLVATLRKTNYFKENRYERAMTQSYQEIDKQLLTQEAQQELLQHRPGNTTEEKMKPKFMEDEEDIGTARCCGCTACSIIITRNKIYCANLGDSRAVAGCYKKKEMVAKDLSVDHKPTQPKESLRISKAGGQVVNNRINNQIALSRAIGDLQFKENPKLKPHEQLLSNLADITVTYLDKDVKFIVIACDGIWDCMTSQEVVSFIDKRIKDVPVDMINPCEIIEQLFDNILSPDPQYKPEGTDNMSCILILFKEQKEQQQESKGIFGGLFAGFMGGGSSNKQNNQPQK